MSSLIRIFAEAAVCSGLLYLWKKTNLLSEQVEQLSDAREKMVESLNKLREEVEGINAYASSHHYQIVEKRE